MLSAASGTTRKQLERAKAARSPEPCEPTGVTDGNSAAPEANVQFAGTNRVRPGLPSQFFPSFARANRGPSSELPASAASTGAAKRRNVTAEEMGLPGRPIKG